MVNSVLANLMGSDDHANSILFYEFLDDVRAVVHNVVLL